MKKTVFIAVALMALVFTSCKDNAADKVNDENVAAAAERDANSGKFPVMAFEETSFDFGTIEQGVAQQHVFKFTNTGESDLVIVDAKGSCGCTVPEWPKAPIAAGADGEILVKFNGSGKNQISKTVTITCNTEKGKETLSIKAFVNPKEGAADTKSPIKVN
ncbi:MAG TPA: DUF1573 domain-containing protein [Flavobacteriaceae bacterium]|mgnify:CR=1 FL=1|nr:DUF1573 domain-containing protein [Flavobacteriaceae bacterium]MCB9212544.1 DUF1573 domain-containing protein [Alteromonas sp.]HPF10612.1 DUF1573 domain-containing protein [Flavobacteriaceae bacterium]HQU20894.1 DUF1573 domain-containing protein [Flavobacteriaceae bacterium]HQU64378.1 DUF1573 domain-containing protein [Flavobacteriaceae bacterium]